MAASTSNEISALDILAEAVRIAVGDRAEPRPGQVAATKQVAAALHDKEHAAAVAPTGSGKSFTLLSAAGERAVNADERTIISTESLSLQKQVLEKDAPVVVEAVKNLTGRELKVAVLKGTNNYLDPRRLLYALGVVTGVDKELPWPEWQQELERVSPLVVASRIREDLDADIDGEQMKALLLWAIEQYADDDAPGDRHSCPVDVTYVEWELVSASSAEATPSNFWLEPKASIAKNKVAEADIVVVNHTLLAIQAAHGMNIVLGNTNYGPFHNILVDEAHALAGEVRAQGSSSLSGRAIMSLARAVSHLAAGADRWMADAQFIADSLNAHLNSMLGQQNLRRLGIEENPISPVQSALSAWLKTGIGLIEPAENSPDVRTSMNAQRVRGRLDEMQNAISSVSEHRRGEARWVEVVDAGRGAYATVQSSPVDVSGKIRRNLWYVVDDPNSDPRPLGVACVSATLPTGFPIQVGLFTQVQEYPSPFEDAYANSALYIPWGPDYRDELMLPSRWSNTPKFDVLAHRRWAAKQIVELVRANTGGALILAATAENGKEYVERLRTALNVTVYSQWDGGTAASLVERWREDKTSILVGTRSLMTGVDAPGDTCSLVVLDRIPRSPSNPIDDARLEDIQARLQVDKWAADRLVYAADAGLLTAQAAGRLIRSVSDRGMVAVLDPRLLKYKHGGFTGYQEPVRDVYMRSLRPFGVKMTGLEQATSWLVGRGANRAAA